jgi:hypothetical protein
MREIVIKLPIAKGVKWFTEGKLVGLENGWFYYVVPENSKVVLINRKGKVKVFEAEKFRDLLAEYDYLPTPYDIEEFGDSDDIL